MGDELAEKIVSLASRVNNLTVHYTGSEGRALLDLQDRLAQLQLDAIVKDLNAEHENYARAIEGLNDAIAHIGEATAQIETVAETIRLVAKAASLVETAIKTVA